MTQPKDNNDNYDRKTLLVAGAIFVGFCLLTYFLPTIMGSVGTDLPYLTGAIIAAFLKSGGQTEREATDFEGVFADTAAELGG